MITIPITFARPYQHLDIYAIETSLPGFSQNVFSWDHGDLVDLVLKDNKNTQINITLHLKDEQMDLEYLANPSLEKTYAKQVAPVFLDSNSYDKSFYYLK